MLKAIAMAGGLAASASFGPAGAQPPTPSPTRNFVQAASASDQYEIQAGRVAAAQSQDARIRAFAMQMIQDHTSTAEALRQATATSGLPPPPMGLSEDGRKFLAELQSLRGPDFDKAYARQQVLAHDQALTVEQGYASQGPDPNVRKAAQSALPTVQHHLEMAQQMQAVIGGS